MRWIEEQNGTGGWWACNWRDLVSGNLSDEKDIWYTKFTEDRFTGMVEGQCQGYLLEGKKDGPWVEYHDNGRLLQKGTYKNGKKIGAPWVEYNDAGNIEEPRSPPRLYPFD
ncbi:hypothetical protein OAS67_08825 [Alphaproteobacteria bacterium]|nr:hypothetical protein [Alphaproteobacteria bacterium]